MNDQNNSKLIDRLCDQFEKALRDNGAVPVVADFLAQVDAGARAELLRELLLLESELLPADKWQPRLKQHLEDFPEFGEIVNEFLVSDPPTVEAKSKTGSVAIDARRIGPYKILQTIGEGGMGSVYMAEQEKPVKRRVALKIIKTGLDSKQIIARFEAERQALAMMDHPSIARILDAGTTETGQPFFAMELVKGIPLTEYCDRHKLSIPDRLQIFEQICEGVQHAHQKGIIHRDLKPANILVAEYNGKPVPKIIDFGLAKALEVTNKLTDKTMFTEFGQVMGTLKYMSPEQAGLDSLDIDTRSDIYTLGIILYELLTGSTPLDGDSFKGQALLKILELVREQESPRPSSKLTTSKQTLSTVTELRQIDPRKLTQILAGDLDWIVMKAIEKDRNRRYLSAGAFGEDIHRYLGDEPVEARPPSRSYKIQKFVKKNRGLVTAAAMIAFLLVAGIIGTSYGFYVAEQSRKDAVEETKKANNETAIAKAAKEKADARTTAAEIAQKNAVNAQNAADKNAEKSRVAAELASQAEIDAKQQAEQSRSEQKTALTSAKRSSDVLQIVVNSFQNASPWESSDTQLSAKQVLVNAYATMRESDLDDLGKSNLLWALAISFQGVGDYESAVAASKELVSILTSMHGENNQKTLNAKRVLANSYHLDGKVKQAFELRTKTLATQQKQLGETHADSLATMRDLGDSLVAVGQQQEGLNLREKALTVHEEKYGKEHIETLASMDELANSYHGFERFDEAIGLREKALASMKRLKGEDHPATLDLMTNLAFSYDGAKRYQDALKLKEATLAIQKLKLGETHPVTLMSMNNLSNSYQIAGRQTKALELGEKTLALVRENMDVSHPDALIAMNDLAVKYKAIGRLDDALKLEEETLSIRKATLSDGHPDMLISMHNLAGSYYLLGRLKESVELFETTLAKQKITHGETHQYTQLSVTCLGVALRDSNIKSAYYLARAEFEDAEKLLLTMKNHHGPHVDVVGEVSRKLTIAFLAQRKYAEALIAIDEWLILLDPNSPADRKDIASAKTSQAACYLEQGKPAEAEKVVSELLNTEDVSPTERARCLSILGLCQASQKQFVNGESNSSKSFNQLANNLENTPIELLWCISRAAERVIRVYELSGKTDEAQTWERKRQEIDDKIKQLNAIRIAPQDAAKINGSIWTKASPRPTDKNPPLTANELESIREVCKQYPSGMYFNTLGVAEFRIGNFREAIVAAEQSAKRLPTEMGLPSAHPSDLAILAMSHHALEDFTKANEFRQRMDEALKLDAFQNDGEARALASEVSDIFDAGK